MQLPIVSAIPGLGGLTEVASRVTVQGRQVRKQRQEKGGGLASLEELCLLPGSFVLESSIQCREVCEP